MIRASGWLCIHRDRLSEAGCAWFKIWCHSRVFGGGLGGGLGMYRGVFMGFECRWGATVDVRMVDTCCTELDDVAAGVVVVPGLYWELLLFGVIRASLCYDCVYLCHGKCKCVVFGRKFWGSFWFSH